ncbi:MAG: hypothetical protein JSR76_02440 [Verrucomicrobia bacterium]|nr:hypothetical protein [Verrucomicrobiota bacterium]
MTLTTASALPHNKEYYLQEGAVATWQDRLVVLRLPSTRPSILKACERLQRDIFAALEWTNPWDRYDAYTPLYGRCAALGCYRDALALCVLEDENIYELMEVWFQENPARITASIYSMADTELRDKALACLTILFLDSNQAEKARKTMFRITDLTILGETILAFAHRFFEPEATHSAQDEVYLQIGNAAMEAGTLKAAIAAAHCIRDPIGRDTLLYQIAKKAYMKKDIKMLRDVAKGVWNEVGKNSLAEALRALESEEPLSHRRPALLTPPTSFPAELDLDVVKEAAARASIALKAAMTSPLDPTDENTLALLVQRTAAAIAQQARAILAEQKAARGSRSPLAEILS